MSALRLICLFGNFFFEGMTDDGFFCLHVEVGCCVGGVESCGSVFSGSMIISLSFIQQQ